ncbi:MAG: TonB-dependent receptor [Pseudomonadota bacterium]
MSHFTVRSFCCAATICCLLAGPTYSQEESAAGRDGAENTEIDTITVTGTRRNRALIESELSVTVLDPELIEQARIRDFRRIEDLVPNVQFNELGQQGSIFITVRGVESNPFIVNRAAVYIDGIPFRELSNSVLSQVESIEVLRGPQGALYGANSESGLIIVNTKAPTNDLSGNVRLTSTNFSSGEGLGIDGFISGPLVGETLTGSLSASMSSTDAYVKNIGTSTGETGQFDERFLHGRLQWTPTDRLTLNATTYWLDVEGPGVFDQQYMPLDIDLYNTLYADFFNGGRRIGNWTALEDAPKSTTWEETVLGISADYDLKVGDLSFAASYREVEEDAAGLDFDLTATPIVAGRETDKEDYTQVELRFASPAENRLNYIVGVSYYNDSDKNTKASFIGPGNLNSYIFAPEQREDAKDVSVFGTLNWHATPKWRIGAGLRFDRAERTTIQKAGELDLGLGSVITFQEANLSKTFEEVLPRVYAHYRANDDLSFHASAARGYIPGGFNLVAFQQGVVDEDVISYDSETMWSREIGFKWRSEDRRLRASGAIFYITSDNWQEVQIATDASGRPISTDFIGSDASIRSQGVEAEASWQVTDTFSVRGHVGIVDAEYRDLQLDEDLNVAGQSIQFVPDYDAGLAVQFRSPTGLFFRAEINSLGETALRARGDAVRRAFETVGAQVGYERDWFLIRIFGENLTDERRASGLAIENLAFGTDGLFYSPLGAPRVVGVEISATF